MSNSYTETELKFFQKQIRSTNTTLQNLNRKGVSDKAGSYLDDIMGIVNITNKGYFKYSMKYLKGMSENDIEAYLESVDELNRFMDLMKKSEDFSEALSGNISNVKDIESLMWNMYAELQKKGIALDSDQVKAITENTENLEDDEIAEVFNKMMELYQNPTSEGLADFDEMFNSISTLRRAL
jgi:hypothetical protein